MVFLTHVIISLLIRQHLREWFLMKYIPALITCLNCNNERKSSQERPPQGNVQNGILMWVSKWVSVCVCRCAYSLWCLGYYRTSLHTDTYSCLVATRRYLISCTGSDWLLSFCLSSHPSFYLLMSPLLQAVRTGGRWDLPALCWSCCTSRCPRV